MTERDATTKTCWRSVGRPEYDKCLGSACMAWRWARSPMGSVDALAENEPAAVVLPIDRAGDCGMVGRP